MLRNDNGNLGGDCNGGTVLRLCGVALGAEERWLWFRCGKSYRAPAIGWIGPAISAFPGTWVLLACCKANCRLLRWQASTFCKLPFAVPGAICAAGLRSAAR
jgi:hypothetical protein